MGNVHVCFVAGASEHEDAVMFEAHGAGNVRWDGEAADGLDGIDADLLVVVSRRDMRCCFLEG